jgi:hypothetical protein
MVPETIQSTDSSAVAPEWSLPTASIWDGSVLLDKVFTFVADMNSEEALVELFFVLSSWAGWRFVLQSFVNFFD